MVEFSLEKVYEAHSVLSKIARKTDLNRSTYFSGKNEIYLKTENLQLTGSFKLRGAYYKISKLSKEEKQKGVIACSAGNHAQGVALAAKENKIKATIFIPSSAPLSKIEATKSYGAEVCLVDGVYDDAYAEAVKFQEKTGGIFIHPFDDIDVIAGQGTIALEILDQIPDVDAIVVPIGGGGLISGVAATIKQIKPDCKVYGVQTQSIPSMFASIAYNQRTSLDYTYTFADGTAVKFPGELTFQLCKQYVDDVFTSREDETASAVLALMEKEKLVAEGAGALSVSACLFDKIPLENKKVVCIISGGNIDFNILSRVVTSALIKTNRLSNLSIYLTDKPGELANISSIIAREGANIIEVNRDYSSFSAVNGCCLRISLETRNNEHLQAVKSALIKNGYEVNLSN